MIQLQKYTWLIDTIRRAGRISLEEISARWERNKDLSDYRPLSRATFNRWKEAIYNQFGIIIACQRTGGYLYYIENPEEIDDNELKKWMLDSFSVGNLIGEHLSLRDRILVSPAPSAHRHLSTLLEAMNDNRTVAITYCGFNKSRSYTFPVEPYCVKLFEGRWYVLARDVQYDELRIYGLDRIERIEPTGDTFKLPKGFSAAAYFAPCYGIVTSPDIPAERIQIRVYQGHIPYMQSLPLHPSQRLLADHGTYADFELYLAPTYDFIMRLLHVGSMLEVLSPVSLRQQMKAWTSKMYEMYRND